MKKHIIAAAIVIAAVVWSTALIAQPGGGFSKTAPITGTGSGGSPLRLDAFGSCGSGSAVTAIGSNGAITCGSAGGGGTYTEGDNIDITGDVVSLMPFISLDGEDGEFTLEVSGVADRSAVSVGDSSTHTDSINYVSITSTGTIDGETAPHITSGLTIDNDTSNACSGECSFPPTHRALWTKTGSVLFEGSTTVDNDLTVTSTLDANAADIGAGGLSVTGDVQFSGTGTQIESGATTIGQSSGDTLNVYATTTHTAPTTVADLRATVEAVATTGTITDLTLGATTTLLRFTGGGAVTLNSISGGADGRILYIENSTGTDMNVNHEAGGGTTTMRIDAVGASNWMLSNRQILPIIYNSTTARWRIAAQARAPVFVVGSGGITSSGAAVLSSTMAVTSTSSFTGIVRDSGTPPTVSACGTSPGTPTGGSNWWSVVVGTGGVTACTFTYSTKTNAPVCDVRVNNAGEDAYISSVSATAVTITAKTGTTDLSSDTITVRCLGDG